MAPIELNGVARRAHTPKTFLSFNPLAQPASSRSAHLQFQESCQQFYRHHFYNDGLRVKSFLGCRGICVALSPDNYNKRLSALQGAWLDQTLETKDVSTSFSSSCQEVHGEHKATFRLHRWNCGHHYVFSCLCFGSGGF